jgi:hypothetical protein
MFIQLPNLVLPPMLRLARPSIWRAQRCVALQQVLVHSVQRLSKCWSLVPLLIWRLVVRQTYEVLQRNVLPLVIVFFSTASAWLAILTSVKLWRLMAVKPHAQSQLRPRVLRACILPQMQMGPWQNPAMQPKTQLDVLLLMCCLPQTPVKDWGCARLLLPHHTHASPLTLVLATQLFWTAKHQHVPALTLHLGLLAFTHRTQPAVRLQLRVARLHPTL